MSSTIYALCRCVDVFKEKLYCAVLKVVSLLYAYVPLEIGFIPSIITEAWFIF